MVKYTQARPNTKAPTTADAPVTSQKVKGNLPSTFSLQSLSPLFSIIYNFFSFSFSFLFPSLVRREKRERERKREKLVNLVPFLSFSPCLCCLPFLLHLIFCLPNEKSWREIERIFSATSIKFHYYSFIQISYFQ